MGTDRIRRVHARHGFSCELTMRNIGRVRCGIRRQWGLHLHNTNARAGWSGATQARNKRAVASAVRQCVAWRVQIKFNKKLNSCK